MTDAPRFDLYVWWSIYVRAKDMGNAKREHFPLIESVLGKPSVPFQYFKEDGGNYRLVAYMNKPVSVMNTAVLETLTTAFALADGWHVSGLGCLQTGNYQHVYGLWSAQKPLPKAPQLVSMMFEIERGMATHLSEDGGVFISEYDRNNGSEDFMKSPLRLFPPPITEES